ncbi:MAG: hypothetical protein ACRCX2_04490 [Paraclostridium sp.]
MDNKEVIFDFTTVTFDLENPIDIEPRAVSISWTGVSDTSLTCTVIGFSVVDYPRYVNWFLDNSYQGTTHISSNSSYCPSYSFGWLTPGTTYTISANIHKTSNDVYLWGGSRDLTTSGSAADTTPPVVTYFEASQSGDGIRVGVTASDDKSGVEAIVYRVSAPSTYQPSEANFNYPKTMSASNNAYTYTTDGNGNPFVNGSTYWFQATAKDYAGNYSIKKYTSCRFVTTKPSPWYWSSGEINAFTYNGAITNLTYSRWNAFVEKVKEFDRWKNGVNAGKYYLDEAKMTSSDKTLTAYRFNTVRHAIGSMNSLGSGIEIQATGNQVKGSYFIQLADRLNSI